MSAYLISDPSGSGKSTVGRILADRGYQVIETDLEPDLSSWAHSITREKVIDTPPQPFPKEWVEAHGWFWDTEKVSDLISEVGDEPVFFVGGAHNDKDFFHHFEKRFALIVDGEAIKSRLGLREPERWVDGSVELQNVLAWNKKFKDYSIANGSILIDSSAQPEKVADNILEELDVRNKVTRTSGFLL